MSNNGMSREMYDFIVSNEHKLEYDLANGLVITPKGTNGSVCSSTGYLRVKVSGKVLQVHQILSVKYYGERCIGMQINHEDGNKLNNRIENLTLTTLKENIQHAWRTGLYDNTKRVKQKKSMTGATGFRGVIFNRDSKKDRFKYQARIKINGKYKFIGYFNSPSDGAIAYDKKAIELFGNKAITNKLLGLL